MSKEEFTQKPPTATQKQDTTSVKEEVITEMSGENQKQTTTGEEGAPNIDWHSSLQRYYATVRDSDFDPNHWINEIGIHATVQL